MSCLRQLWQFLLTTFLQLDKVPRIVAPDERVTRYIFFHRHVKNGQVSSGAFLPSPKTNDLSVYRTHRCTEKRIWLLGKLFVEGHGKDKGRILARGDLCSAIIFAQGLRIVAVGTPHPRHANVRDWPDDKAQQKMKAVVLAENSSLFFRP